MPDPACGRRMEAVLERRRAFYERQLRDRVLVFVSVNGLSRVSHLRYVPDYRRMCQVQIDHFEARQSVEDDFVPTLQTHFGMGIFGALFGG